MPETPMTPIAPTVPETALPTSPVAPKSGSVWKVVVTIALVVFVAAASYLYYQNHVLQSQLAAKVTPTLPPTPEASVLASVPPSPSPIASVKPGVATYTSPALGITFSYKKDYSDGTSVGVKEVGDKVYVYPTTMKPEDGQYVQIFQKDSSDSLAAAIQKTILSGYSTNDCFVTERPQKTDGSQSSASASYVFADIHVPGEGTLDLPQLADEAAKCPSPYMAVGGLTFFLMDKNHSSKFAFFSIGQYGITGDTDNNTWQDTIKFTN